MPTKVRRCIYTDVLCLSCPQQDERQRAATAARKKKINIYAALSEVCEHPNGAQIKTCHSFQMFWTRMKFHILRRVRPIGDQQRAPVVSMTSWHGGSTER